jgi:serine/threonine protein kinase
MDLNRTFQLTEANSDLTKLCEVQAGTVFANRYSILEQIGSGGHSIVYKAEDLELDETVALKVLNANLPEDDTLDLRFKNEIKFARKIKHPNVCSIYDLVLQPPCMAISMEYLDGVDLSRLIPGQSIPMTKRISIAIGIALGLKAAHQANVVHCDLKPSNVMVDDTFRPIITDFGISRYLGSSVENMKKLLIGTPAYMSPEQFLGNPMDNRTDIYSLGITMYELFTGNLPFDSANSTGYAIMHVQKPVTFPPETVKGLNPVIVDVILKCLAKNPQDRYQSIDDMLKDLQRIDSPHPVSWEPQRKPVILVIDDDRSLRKAVETFLELKGFDVLVASNGEEGVGMALKNKPDLILLDFMMPRMDGFSAAQILGKNQVTAHIPILLVTSIDEREHKTFSRTIGIKEYITKPFNFDDLLNKIYLHLSISRFDSSF